MHNAILSYVRAVYSTAAHFSLDSLTDKTFQWVSDLVVVVVVVVLVVTDLITLVTPPAVSVVVIVFETAFAGPKFAERSTS